MRDSTGFEYDEAIQGPRARQVMLKTLEAVIDNNGRIRLLEEIELPKLRRALVTILEEDSEADVSDTSLLSETALAADWNREEEDEAWRHLQPDR